MHTNPTKMAEDEAMNVEQDAAEVAPVVDQLPFDLQTYADSYSGFAKIHRLQFIANTCPSVAVEALTIAWNTSRDTLAVSLQQELYQALRLAHKDRGSTPPEAPTSAYYAGLEQQRKITRERIDSDIKAYKQNMAKENIRLSSIEMADHSCNCGNFEDARRQYVRVRDYCTTAAHVLEVFQSATKVAALSGNWDMVLSMAAKAKVTKAFATNPASQGIIACFEGLAHLHKGNLYEAGQRFLTVPLEEEQAESPLAAVSPRDVAMMGALCVIADTPREDLINVAQHGSFKEYLAYFPDVREMLRALHAARYTDAIRLLAGVKEHVLLDLHLAKHWTTLEQSIVHRATALYVEPFLTVDLTKMAQAFDCSIEELEDRLAKLIVDGTVQARIDSYKKVLQAKQVNLRHTTLLKGRKLAETYISNSQASMLRAKIIQKNLAIPSASVFDAPAEQTFERM
eukprot:TRINITY_DN10049_c0_g1_i2.p1 TRINITY_DN10049_c0_g1~~TRINITY_DN10049_c0_g1_i2.p1  ORF type:complete len:455 (+),score=108.98 TRINITY_DN10049_c0_g1_i2:417-1781(+)